MVFLAVFVEPQKSGPIVEGPGALLSRKRRVRECVIMRTISALSTGETLIFSMKEDYSEFSRCSTLAHYTGRQRSCLTRPTNFIQVLRSYRPEPFLLSVGRARNLAHHVEDINAKKMHGVFGDDFGIQR